MDRASVLHSTGMMKEYPILYVDDEPENLDVFQAQFAEEFQILCAGSGERALAILEQEKVSILLADQRMPAMSGIELCEQVSSRFPQVVRILVTAYSNHQTVIDAINRGGVSRYMAKPWEDSEVRQVLREAVTRANLQSTVRRLRAAIVQGDRQASAAAERARLLHDLASPINVLSCCSSAVHDLRDQLKAALSGALFEELDLEVTQLRRAAHQAVELYRRSRNKTAELSRGKEDTPVTTLIETVRHLAQAGRHSGARLVTPEAGELTVWCNASDVGRILVNLINNAWQAMDTAGVDDGKARMAAQLDGPHVIIEVSDDGPGVPADLCQHIFEPCVTTKEDTGGSGLGLAICTELAEANQGKIELIPSAPDAPRRGATFRLTLPSCKPQS